MSPDETLFHFFDLKDARRWSFDRTDGLHCEGYALEIEDHRVLFGYGGPLAPEAPEWIAFDSIRCEGLHYFSEREGRWVELVANPPARR